MSQVSASVRKEIVLDIQEKIKSKLPEEKARPILPFVAQYYAMVAEEDLCERKIDDLYGAVMSHWNFMYQREKDEPKVTVFNPRFQQHGWQSTHTVIEIIAKDMPFLVDSVRMALNRYGITIHLVIHPGAIRIVRNEEGQIEEVKAPGSRDTDCNIEAPIYVEVDQQTDPDILAQLEKTLYDVLKDVRLAVDDWPMMLTQAEAIIQELTTTPPSIDKEELAESIAFLRWLVNDCFTFLGYCEYELSGGKTDQVLKAIPNKGLGLLRDEHVNHHKRHISGLTPDGQKMALSDKLLIIAKLGVRSRVHRPVYMDFVSIKQFDSQGQVTGEKRFIGLYTSVAYHSLPTSIPFLRHKIKRLLVRSAFNPKGHTGKELLNVLENYPRDELFQATDDDLFETTMGILHLQERKRIRLFIREDTYGHFFSCLVFVPRDRFNSQLREQMGFILLRELNGEEISFTHHFSESILMRIHFTVRIRNNVPIASYSVKEIEHKLSEAGRTWQDGLREACHEHFGEEKANPLFNKYCNGFPASYTEHTDARTAVYDIAHMEALKGSDCLQMSFYRPLEEINGFIYFKLFSMGSTIALSDVMPLLENMGFRVISERMHEIKINKKTSFWVNDFGMCHAQGSDVDVKLIRGIFEEAFAKIWFNEVENDGFNRLVVTAKLPWYKVAMLRAYSKYFRQINFTYSQTYVEETLNKYPDIANNLVALFEMRFSPKNHARKKEVDTLKNKIKESLDSVSGLDEDRILNQYIDVIMATLRTNYFQKNEQQGPKNYLSFKLSPNLIPDMPLPLPEFEIFVYSPRVEGVHLRGGKVARGGLRWSDRREDFRTEVLGLMKAQQVKNAVIVPSGAKGGFVPKLLPENGDREAIQEEVVACYTLFIKGLLDITDNLLDNKVHAPKDCVRYDGDDPYLVVAADKGTATFSDIANSIAQEYGFWLDDAFASGGSVGYDHKKMGITAKGSWESVKRHFRELGLDTQSQDFTVIGIGDMAGDVFGNGMLLSQHIKLVGAFNHMHIFIDPNPDAQASYQERKRLFELPRSSWADYNKDCISTGGGVFSRAQKTIKLTPEIKDLLKIKQDTLVPNELIKCLLRSRVDLIFNGGIGTYVKATDETHSDVGDRANDALRVNGMELKARVVAEGGNLGFTQLGRVEFNMNGGISNTDFIDNSAGVDCSDHEVNLKILLNNIVSAGDMTIKQRNELLEALTNDVSELVLQNNYSQTQAISLAASRSFSILDEYSAFINDLEKMGRLNRNLEFLPNAEELVDRKASKKGLTRPEISVLFAYSKNALKEELCESEVINDPYFKKVMSLAFPKEISERFSQAMDTHKLKKEIIATQLSSMITDDMGATFVRRLYNETGAISADVAVNFVISCEAFKMHDIWNEIDQLNNLIDAKVQLELMGTIVRLVRRGTRWLIRNHRKDRLDITNSIEHFTPRIQTLFEIIPNLLQGQEAIRFKDKLDTYKKKGVPESLALKVAIASPMISAFDIIKASDKNQLSAEEVARIYFLVGDELQISWFREEIANHPVGSNWDALARAMCRDDLDHQQRAITESLIDFQKKHKDFDEALLHWKNDNAALIDRWQYILADLKATPAKSFTMFTVALRELSDLAQVSNA